MAQISTRTARARAAMELKLGILSALNKLADRDTQQMAVEELQRIAENLPQEGISVFLGCILDVGPEQKLHVRKECVRIFSTLSTAHGDALPPHLPKILSFIMRRLKDPDTQIRDACVETMGVLVVRVPSTAAGSDNAGIGVYTKPLFEAMGEQTKNVQVGAAMCLGKVIESAPTLSPACVHRLAPKIVKLVSAPGFMARAALLAVIGNLAKVVKGNCDEQLLQLVPCVQEALRSSDWTARKAAAETLAALACPGLSKMKPSTIAVLDAFRFDKVKPVRDAVTLALQVWKAVPGPETDGSLKLAKCSQSPSEETPSFSRCWKEVDTDVSSPVSAAQTPGDAGDKAESSVSDDKSSKSSRRKVPMVSDSKMNPDFFRKRENTTPDGWQVEIAVPRASPSQNDSQKSSTVDDNAPAPRDQTAFESPAPQENVPKIEDNAHVCGLTIKASIEQTASWVETTLKEQREEKGEFWEEVPEADELPQSSAPKVGGGGDWFFMSQQIGHLERRQSELLDTLQEFMGSCQESMLSLQDRVLRLERTVDEICRNKSNNGFATQNTPAQLPSRHRNLVEASTRRMAKFVEVDDGSYSDRSGRNSPYSMLNWSKDSVHVQNGSLLRVSTTTTRGLATSTPAYSEEQEDDADEQPPVVRRAWERGSGSSVRHGEGPSARSVWRASKDEATLEAIRGAADDETVVVSDTEKNIITECSKESEQEQRRPTPSWLVWSRAMDSLQSGDIDTAYAEALSAQDDLLLVRMMNQTGPVFDHFSSSTSVSMLRGLAQILSQQHFLDSAFPWLEQVANLVRTKGSEYLGFSLDEKREAVSMLHEASAMDFPERWMGNTVAKLALQLAATWSIDLLE